MDIVYKHAVSGRAITAQLVKLLPHADTTYLGQFLYSQHTLHYTPHLISPHSFSVVYRQIINAYYGLTSPRNYIQRQKLPATTYGRRSLGIFNFNGSWRASAMARKDQNPTVQSTVGCFPELCFLQFSVVQVLFVVVLAANRPIFMHF